MKKLIAISATSIALLSGCVSETQTVDAVDQFIGKQLVSADGTVFIFNADGTMGGTFRGEPVVGRYVSTENEICSTYAQPEQLTGREFCSTPAIEGNTVVFNRRDGSQSALYTIQG